jgi:hypothetical protein
LDGEKKRGGGEGIFSFVSSERVSRTGAPIEFSFELSLFSLSRSPICLFLSLFLALPTLFLTLSALRELVTSSWWILATSARDARRTGSLEEGMVFWLLLWLFAVVIGANCICGA